jgi:hypothetical protein
MYTVLEVREKATWRFDHGSRIPSEGRVFTALCPKQQQQSAWQPGGTPLLLWRYSWFFKWLKDEVEYTGARKRNPEGAASWLYLEGYKVPWSTKSRDRDCVAADSSCTCNLPTVSHSTTDEMLRLAIQSHISVAHGPRISRTSFLAFLARRL